MFKKIILVGAFISLFLTGVATCAAESLFELQVDSDGTEFNSEINSYEFTFMPGDVVDDSFYLVNYSGSPLSLHLAVKGVEMDAKGDLRLLSSQDDSTSLSDWISIPDTIEIAPKSSQEVSFEVHFPGELFETENYYANIFVEMESLNDHILLKEQIGLRLHAQLADKSFILENTSVSLLDVADSDGEIILLVALGFFCLIVSLIYFRSKRARMFVAILAISGGLMYLPFSGFLFANVLGLDDTKKDKSIKDEEILPEVLQPEPEDLSEFIDYDLSTLNVEEVVQPEEAVEVEIKEDKPDKESENDVTVLTEEVLLKFSEISFDTKSEEEEVQINSLELLSMSEEPLDLSEYSIGLDEEKFALEGMLEPGKYFVFDVQKVLGEDNFYIQLFKDDVVVEKFVYDPEGEYLTTKKKTEELVPEIVESEPIDLPQGPGPIESEQMTVEPEYNLVEEPSVVVEEVVVEEEEAAPVEEEEEAAPVEEEEEAAPVEEEIVEEVPVEAESVQEEVIPEEVITPEEPAPAILEKIAKDQVVDEEKMIKDGVAMRFEYLDPYQSLSSMMITDDGQQFDLKDALDEVVTIGTEEAWMFVPHRTPLTENQFINQPPEVTFDIVGQTPVKDGLMVSFSAAGTEDPENDNLTYVWTFFGKKPGDNLIKTGKEVSVFLSKTGQNSFSLKATDEFDESDEKKISYFLSKDYEFERESIVSVIKDDRDQDKEKVKEKDKGFYVKFSDETIVITGITVSTQEQEVETELGEIVISRIRPGNLMGLITIEPDAETLDYIVPENYVIIVGGKELTPYYSDATTVQYSLKKIIALGKIGTAMTIDLGLKIVVPAFTPEGFYPATISYSFY